MVAPRGKPPAVSWETRTCFSFLYFTLLYFTLFILIYFNFILFIYDLLGGKDML